MKKAQYAEPNPHLKRERELLGMSEAQAAKLSTNSDWARALRTVIGNRCRVIVGER